MAFFGRRPPCVWPDTPLHEVLRLFKTGQGHMALVKDVVDQVSSYIIYMLEDPSPCFVGHRNGCN